MIKKVIPAFIAMLGLCAFAQMRMIPHVTPVGTSFETRFILVNPTAESQSYNLSAFSSAGASVADVSGVMDPYETRFFTTQELFSSDQVSHFSIGADDAVRITAVYQDAAHNNSAAHVGESATMSSVWRIYPGDLDDVIDGIALVNTTSTPQEVHVRQVSSAGQMVAETTLFDGSLAANAKGLYLFQTDFNTQDGAYYEIYSDGETALTALRFSTIDGAQFFWQTAATALPELPPLSTMDPRVGQVATLSTRAHSVSGRAVIADEHTIRLENFTYDGRGIDVQVYLAQNANYRAGISISGDLRGSGYNNATLEFTIPANVTLDDFNSISIWCVPAGADFGSGTFQ